MRIPAVLCVLTCCCAVLAACTAAGRKGPDATVTTPSVGKPAPPASAQAALSTEQFTPYAALGLSNDDGLAPGESGAAINAACMTAAGYPNAGAVLENISLGGTASLSFAMPWGGWGYLGEADAQQYGFQFPPGSALSTLGLDLPSANPASLSAAEQAAAGKCATIAQDFSNAIETGPLAGIGTLANDVLNDTLHDPAVKTASRAWSACMAKNGYSFTAPQNVFQAEMQAMYGKGPRTIGPGSQVSGPAERAQIAAAVTDADCTQSTDLSGIYFAVQTSYEQQLVTANQQGLSDAVHRYRATYARELSKLTALLRTAKAQPFGPIKRARAGA
jgi:hypothetical protein